jgi:predicted alpha/beta superfamily hydrolase
VVGVHAGEARMQEYGIAGRPDYQNRGSRAGAYSHFLLQELLPFIERNYRPEKPYSYAGFSLGGLAAFDIVWKHPDLFHQAGIFSGALWWRAKPFDPDNPDADRIVHQMVDQDPPRKGLRFWFQTGTHDEVSDRNNNGVIDSIDDTLDLIRVLKKKGGALPQDLYYLEVEKGRHHPETWAKVLPDFLAWAFGKEAQTHSG